MKYSVYSLMWTGQCEGSYEVETTSSPLQSPSISPHGSSAEQQLLEYPCQVAGLHWAFPGGLQVSFSFSGSPCLKFIMDLSPRYEMTNHNTSYKII